MQGFVKFNSNLIVKNYKYDTQMYTSITEMEKYKNRATGTTVLFNDFTERMDATYFLQDSPLLKNTVTVYKKSPNQEYYNFVVTLRGIMGIKDYNIHNNDNYSYMVIATLQKGDGTYDYQIYTYKNENNEEVMTHVKWDYWSITTIEEVESSTPDVPVYFKTGKTWRIGLNLEQENLTQNLNVTSWDTLGKYPKISRGERNYQSGTVTCLLGMMEEIVDMKNTYQSTLSQDSLEIRNVIYVDRYTCLDSISKLKIEPSYNYLYYDVNSGIYYRWAYFNVDPHYEKAEETFKNYRYTERLENGNLWSRETEKLLAWNEFCADGNLKLLKDVKGHVWIVQIVGTPTADIKQGMRSMPTTISFNWSEVEDASNASIMSSFTELEE